MARLLAVSTSFFVCTLCTLTFMSDSVQYWFFFEVFDKCFDYCFHALSTNDKFGDNISL